MTADAFRLDCTNGSTLHEYGANSQDAIHMVSSSGPVFTYWDSFLSAWRPDVNDLKPQETALGSSHAAPSSAEASTCCTNTGELELPSLISELRKQRSLVSQNLGGSPSALTEARKRHRNLNNFAIISSQTPLQKKTKTASRCKALSSASSASCGCLLCACHELTVHSRIAKPQKHSN